MSVCFWITRALEDTRVAVTVSLRKSFHHSVNLLGLARQTETPQELSVEKQVEVRVSQRGAEEEERLRLSCVTVFSFEQDVATKTGISIVERNLWMWEHQDRGPRDSVLCSKHKHTKVNSFYLRAWTRFRSVNSWRSTKAWRTLMLKSSLQWHSTYMSLLTVF